jgi:hypothetical protein
VKKIFVFFLVFIWLLAFWPVREARAVVAYHTFAISTPITATTTFTIPIPATIAVNEDLYVLFVSRDHASGTALATLTDNDAGGNPWTRIGGSTDRKLNLFWKKSTSDTASKTITVAGCVGSCAGGMSAFTGGTSGNPTTNLVIEDNISGNETHAGFSPDVADSFIVFGVINATNDIDITLLAAATLGALEPEQWAAESTGGSDCKSTLTGKVNSGTTTTGNFTWSQTNAITRSVSFAIKPPAATTTIGNGASEPSSVTIAPEAGATDLDNFTLVTSAGVDTVTAATVTLDPANAYNNIAQVDITDDANTAKCTAVSGLTSNTVTFSTCNIGVTTSSTNYKIRITPKSHDNMPAVPGASYATTGTITAFTSTNGHSGTDSGSATITIDNASPANVTAATGTAGIEEVVLSWTNPGDADFHSSVVLRRAGTAVGDTPVEGSTYIVGNTIGSSTVACVVATPTAGCTDTGLTGGTAYHYKIFAKDSRDNYSQTGVVPPQSPLTPTAKVISVAISDGLITYGTMSTGEIKTTITLSDTQTLTNDGNVSETFNIKGQNTTCPWTLAGTAGSDQYVHQFCKKTDVTCTSPPTNYTALTTGYTTLYTGVAVSGTRQIDLRLIAPTATSCGGQQNVDVTIQATQ